MKKIYLILLTAIVCLTVSSCKKDEVKKPEVLDIAGNWRLTALSTDYIFGDKVVASQPNQSTSDYVDNMNFKSDGTGVMLVGGVSVRSFKYYVADLTIHFSAVTDIKTKTLVGTGGFVSYITKHEQDNLEFTDKEFFYYYVVYGNDRYDQLQRHITLVRE